MRRALPCVLCFAVGIAAGLVTSGDQARRESRPATGEELPASATGDGVHQFDTTDEGLGVYRLNDDGRSYTIVVRRAGLGVFRMR
jgi:hypothetical protein